MAATTLSLIPVQTLAADFRAWGSGVDGTFTTLGLIRTSDTGQINWATVATPVGISASQGYSIFRFNDSLQGTYPVFIKIEYGSDSGSASNPGLFFTVGTGSDGSGSITGTLLARTQIVASSNSAVATPCYFSGNTDRFCMALWPLSATSSEYMFFSIERTKDSSGTTNGNGLLVFIANIAPASWNVSKYLVFSGTAPSSYNAWNCNVPTSASNQTGGAYRNTTAVYPVKCWTPGESVPASNFFMYQVSDIAPATTTFSGTVLLTLYDSAITGTYLPLGFSAPANVFTTATTNRGSTGALVSIIMRYE